jgi:hypothetical protein
MRIKNHSIFTNYVAISGCYRTHLTCELLAYASKNVNGDVPSELIKTNQERRQKRRGGGGRILCTLGLIKALPGLAPKYYGVNQLAERSQLCPVDQPEFLRDKNELR